MGGAVSTQALPSARKGSLSSPYGIIYTRCVLLYEEEIERIGTRDLDQEQTRDVMHKVQTLYKDAIRSMLGHACDTPVTPVESAPPHETEADSPPVLSDSALKMSEALDSPTLSAPSSGCAAPRSTVYAPARLSASGVPITQRKHDLSGLDDQVLAFNQFLKKTPELRHRALGSSTADGFDHAAALVSLDATPANSPRKDGEKMSHTELLEELQKLDTRSSKALRRASAI